MRLIFLTTLTLCFFQTVYAQTVDLKLKDRDLYNAIVHMDSVMFDAFNNHNIDVLKKVFAENVEFYHDRGGLSDYKTTMENFKVMFASNKAGALRRELVKGTLEVYPIPGFGAVEIGLHKFIHTENGKEEIATFKFIHTWQYKDNKWKATRVISVGHN